MNENGHPKTLDASHPGNQNPLRHGVYSEDGKALEPRAHEIAEGVMAAPR